MQGQEVAEEWQRVVFRSRSAAELVGCWHSAGADRAVIICHGMESCKEGDKSVALADMLATAGVDVLRFDFSFVGESEGNFEDITVSGEVEDLAGAWTFVRQRVTGPIGIIGSSLGGTVSLLFAAEQPGIAAIATIAAVAYPGRRARALSEAERAQWRNEGAYDLFGTRVGSAFLDDVERLDVPAAMPRVDRPLLLTHGTADQIVPVDDAQALADVAAGPAEVRLYDGADHRFSDPDQRAALLREIVSWMVTQITK